MLNIVLLTQERPWCKAPKAPSGPDIMRNQADHQQSSKALGSTRIDFGTWARTILGKGLISDPLGLFATYLDPLAQKFEAV